MKKSTQQLENEFPATWELMQETTIDEAIWDEVEDEFSSTVDAMMECTDLVSGIFNISKEQALLMLIETACARTETEE